MFRSITLSLLIASASLVMTGCSTSPPSDEKKEALHDASQLAIKEFVAQDPSLRGFLDRSYGYAVFPSVGKAALVIGGAYGKGLVFKNGEPIGFATIGQTTIGVQIGGDTFTEIIAFESRESLERFKQGKIAFAANAGPRGWHRIPVIANRAAGCE